MNVCGSIQPTELEMKKTEYSQETAALFHRWKKARPMYEFVHDGIADFSEWCKAQPKTLFLLKENPDNEWEPKEGLTTSSGRFSQNIARWHHALKCLLNDYSKIPLFDVDGLPKVIKDIALVEVKKTNQGRRTSERKEIHAFADRDKTFLRDQIEIIQPDVVVCCGTGDAYESIIYGNEAWKPIESSQVSFTNDENNTRQCYSHRGRLVIDFYHPTPIGRNDLNLFLMLCEMIRTGRVFDYFEWNNIG